MPKRKSNFGSVSPIFGIVGVLVVVGIIGVVIMKSKNTSPSPVSYRPPASPNYKATSTTPNYKATSTTPNYIATSTTPNYTATSTTPNYKATLTTPNTIVLPSGVISDCKSDINSGLCNKDLTAGNFQAVMQGDGNLVVYDITNALPGAGAKAVWASNSFGKGPFTYNMQGDGNLVVYDKDVKAIWATGTQSKNGPFRSIMQADGNLVIYDKNNKALWSSK